MKKEREKKESKEHKEREKNELKEKKKRDAEEKLAKADCSDSKKPSTPGSAKKSLSEKDLKVLNSQQRMMSSLFVKKVSPDKIVNSKLFTILLNF